MHRSGGRLRSGGIRSEARSRAYGAMLAERSMSGVQPIIPWEEPEGPSEDEVPPEYRGPLWAALTHDERLELVARSKGWQTKLAERARESAAWTAMMNRLRARADAGEFRTIADLEKATRLELEKLQGDGAFGVQLAS